MMGHTLSERELISRIRRQANRTDQGLVKGIGDDCAVLRNAENRLSLITTDALVESVHFDISWHPPFLLGRKTASVNISDIAAMGGIPRFVLLAMAVPAVVESEWLTGFLDGFLSVLDEQGAVLIGGDTVRSTGPIVCSVTVLGEGDKDRILYRHSAQVGDLIWVSGTLGDAAAGLAMFSSIVRRPSALTEWPELCKAHLDPTAEVELGLLLAVSGLVHAMMDISDGLATDLAHICEESRVGAQVFAEQIPISDQLVAASRELAVLPLDWALRGGEDYHLLFTASSTVGERLEKLVYEKMGKAIYCVGRIVEGNGVALFNSGKSQEIAFGGFDHFARHG
ncbi:MAG: thiamine-phosphate kinase [Deltaproteobacteria bacterium RIFOXYD12_FULL_50_9]|nr:MAG: thiamine-phosphate kinase [Deltaproteobacteria bacterium RIFOXYD12_FULL_50_9]